MPETPPDGIPAVDGSVDGWMPLPADPSPSTGGWVYCLWCTNAAPPRAIGASRILYIGKGDGQRLAQLRTSLKNVKTHGPFPHHAFGWLHTHNAVRRNAGAMEDRHPLMVQVWVKPLDGADASGVPQTRALVEALLLNDHYRRHGELPLLNRKHEGWLAGTVLKALTQHILGSQGLHPRVGDWAELCTSHVLSNAAGPPKGRGEPWSGPWFALVWFWPASWSSDAHQDEWTGRLALLEVDASRGERPERLDLGSKHWLPNTRVTASAAADCLAGASADQDEDAATALTTLWAALTDGGSLPQSLESLRDRIDHADKSEAQRTE